MRNQHDFDHDDSKTEFFRLLQQNSALTLGMPTTKQQLAELDKPDCGQGIQSVWAKVQQG